MMLSPAIHSVAGGREEHLSKASGGALGETSIRPSERANVGNGEPSKHVFIIKSTLCWTLFHKYKMTPLSLLASNLSSNWR